MHTAYRKFFRIARHELVYLKFIIEAYEGLAVLSTVDREGPIVQIMSTPSLAEELDLLLVALSGEIVLSEVGPLQAQNRSGEGDCHA
jgi:hypothetical protein